MPEPGDVAPQLSKKVEELVESTTEMEARLDWIRIDLIDSISKVRRLNAELRQAVELMGKLEKENPASE
jgi:hypothetical protein